MRKRNIDPWEAALIKAMLTTGTFTRDQIIARFTRPERTVNPARINEIANGEIYDDVAPAIPAQGHAYLRTYHSPNEARQGFFEENPLHPVNLSMLFSLKEGPADILNIDETDRVECKESLNFGNRADYARIFASFANRRGGFLLFGVRDQDKQIKGIQTGRLQGYDSAKLSQYLSEHFTPSPVWEKAEWQIAANTIGVIYVYPALQKPIICTKNDGHALREADIYYRYPGETRRIRYGELVQLLGEQARKTERQWADVLSRVERAGVENVAILDTVTGEVAGPSGRFLIDEKLLPKLRFVAEGHFSETEGEPTLKLIGELEPRSMRMLPEGRTVVKKVHLTDFDLMKDFVRLNRVKDPAMYLRYLAHSAKIWLPVYFYARQARLDDAAVLDVIRGENNTRQKHITELAKRIKNRTQPSGAPKALSFAQEREAFRTKASETPSDEDTCKKFLKAVRTLEAGEVESDYLLPMLRMCFDKFGKGKLATEIQYALAHVDVVWHVQVTGNVSTPNVFSAA